MNVAAWISVLALAVFLGLYAFDKRRDRRLEKSRQQTEPGLTEDGDL